VSLEGSAVLPLDVWKSWPKTKMADLLNADTVSDVNLTADHLDLKAVSLLTGDRFPLAGSLSGQLRATGPVSGLSANGTLKLSGATLPLPSTDRSATQIDAQLALENSVLRFDSFTASDSTGPFQLSGTAQIGNLLAPKCQLKIALPDSRLTFPGRLTARSSMQLLLEGAVPKLKLTGSGSFSDLKFQVPPEIGFLWAQTSAPTQHLPPLLGAVSGSWQPCELDLQLTPAAAPGESATVPVLIRGTFTAPKLEGTLHLGSFAATTHSRPIQVEEASLVFNAPTQDPTLAIRVAGQAKDLAFQTSVTGTLSKPVYQVSSVNGSIQDQPGNALPGKSEQSTAIWKFLTDPPQNNGPKKSPAPPASGSGKPEPSVPAAPAAKKP
jgi:autotransporter translocation and assembly factor TamB